MSNKKSTNDDNNFKNISDESKDLLGKLESNDNNTHSSNILKESNTGSLKPFHLAITILCTGILLMFVYRLINSQSVPNKIAPARKVFTKLSGTVYYPSDFVPNMKICSVNATNRVESCEDFPAAKRPYKYFLNLDAPGEYWIYWSTESYRNKTKMWIGSCPPDRTGKCREFWVTRFRAHPNMISIPNVDIGNFSTSKSSTNSIPFHFE